jgi:hypothetical protein
MVFHKSRREEPESIIGTQFENQLELERSRDGGRTLPLDTVRTIKVHLPGAAIRGMRRGWGVIFVQPLPKSPCTQRFEAARDLNLHDC